MAKEYDKIHYNNIDIYAQQVAKIYDSALKEGANIGTLAGDLFDDSKPFSFVDYPITKDRINKLTKSLAADIDKVVLNGIDHEWTLSNNKNSELCRMVFGDNIGKLSKEQEQRYFSNNHNARDAFKVRRTAGLGLSDRVWKFTDQFKQEIELGIDCGLRDRLSAVDMARDLKQYQQHPDKLFRRVRNEHGQLVLSKAAKVFNPGQGVYRSSARNAQRLARTEINMAYRSSDHERWQQLDFVVGVEVRRSNATFYCPMCESLKGKYPKGFVFSGWHPQCRCHAISILKTPEEMQADSQRILNGEPLNGNSVNKVGEVNDGFTKWIDDNKSRFGEGTTPYFIRDNFVDGKIDNGLMFKQSTKRVKTDVEKASIQTRWSERVKSNKLTVKVANNVLAVAKDFPEVDTSTMKSLLTNNNLSALKIETRSIAKTISTAKIEERRLSRLLDDVKGVKSEFGIDATRKLYDAVDSKLAQWKDLDLPTQAKKLKFEINWIEEKKAYSTWKQAQNAYKKELVRVDYEIDKLDIVDSVKDTATLAKLSKNKTLKTLSQEWDQLLSGTGSNIELKAKAAALNKQYAKVEQARLVKLNKSAKDVSFFNAKHKTNESKHWTESERLEVDGLRGRYLESITKNNNDYRHYAVTNAQDALSRKLRGLSLKYVDQKATLGHIDGLTTKEVQASLKRYLDKVQTGSSYYSSSIGGAFKGGNWGDYVHLSDNLKAKGVKMTADEISLIGRYTSGSGFINGYLSGKDTGLSWSGLLDDYRIAINGALEKMPRYNGVSYRGMQDYAVETIKEMQECFKSGTPYVEKCVMSTSTNIVKADAFDGYSMFKIYGRTGSDCKMISSFSSENEVIFRSGSKFKILSITQQKTTLGIGKRANVWVVELEDINL